MTPEIVQIESAECQNEPNHVTNKETYKKTAFQDNFKKTNLRICSEGINYKSTKQIKNEVLSKIYEDRLLIAPPSVEALKLVEEAKKRILMKAIK